MNASVLLDTNVLLYAISTAPGERGKKVIARELLARADYGLSVQILQEFYVNATRGSNPALTHEDAVSAVRELGQVPVAPMDVPLMEQAFRFKVRYRLSYWDAAVISAAKSLGARLIYSEDLNHGQAYDGITVENPFRQNA